MKFCPKLKREVPKQLEFFEGGISREFEIKAQSIGLSSESIEFLNFLQSDICENLSEKTNLKFMSKVEIYITTIMTQTKASILFVNSKKIKQRNG